MLSCYSSYFVFFFFPVFRQKCFKGAEIYIVMKKNS